MRAIINGVEVEGDFETLYAIVERHIQGNGAEKQQPVHLKKDGTVTPIAGMDTEYIKNVLLNKAEVWLKEIRADRKTYSVNEFITRLLYGLPTYDVETENLLTELETRT